MKNVVKSLIMISLCFIIMFLVPIKSHAATSLADIIGGGEFFRQEANNDSLFNEAEQKDDIMSLYNMMLAIGIIVAVIGGMYIGIKFITTGVEGQAKIKEKAIPFVIGCIVVFGAFGIWKVAINVTDKAIPTEEFVTKYQEPIGPTLPATTTTATPTASSEPVTKATYGSNGEHRDSPMVEYTPLGTPAAKPSSASPSATITPAPVTTTPATSSSSGTTTNKPSAVPTSQPTASTLPPVA